MKHQRRLDRLVAQHTQRPTKPAETKLVIPNIIDFVTGKNYLNQPNLYPRQALLLKLRMSRVPWNLGGGPLIVRPR